MPLPTDEKILALSEEFLRVFEQVAGLHPGFRPMHARGLLLGGTFRPTPAAATLSRALHFARPVTPVTGRFSNFSGIPLTPDNDPDADPRGCAVRFHLGRHQHTDIISHSTPYFPARNAEDFLALLHATIASNAVPAPGSPLEQHLRVYPKARAFLERPKPVPSSYAREAYYSPTAVLFVNQAGRRRYGRYRIVPEEGTEFIADEVAHARPPYFLFEELQARMERGEPVRFRLVVQLAEAGDEVSDSTAQWPEDRPLLDVGQLEFTDLVPEPTNSHEQQHLIFDPLPRLDGIEPSDDPLLELRAAVYLLSGRRRRAAFAAPVVPPAGQQEPA